MTSSDFDPAVGRTTSREVGSGPAWDDIERLVAEVSAEAQQARSPGEFYGPLLTCLVRLLPAFGGAVWTTDARRGFQLVCQMNLPDDFAISGARDAHGALLDQTVREARSLRVRAEIAIGGAGSRASKATNGNAPAGGAEAVELLLCPIRVAGQVCGVLEIVERSGESAPIQQAHERLLEAICELAGDFHRNRELADLRQWRADAARVEDFLQQVHRGLDLRATCYALANEGRRLLGCDRVSVLVRRGRSYRTFAVSGVDLVDRRAALVQALERLACAVLATGEPAYFRDGTPDLPPEWDSLLHAFVDESRARDVAILPLRSGPEDGAPSVPLLGALVIERFTADVPLPLDEQRREVVLRHGALALHNALEYHSVPFATVLRRLSGAGPGTPEGRSALPVVVAALAVLAVLLLLLLPVDFRVEARGELQPEVRRAVFAPADGVVQQVYVDHAQTVAAGDLLLEMRQTELDFEFALVLGELQTAGKQLESIQATRLLRSRGEESRTRNEELLTAEEEELKKRVAGLEQQRTILLGQKEDLQVKSPLSGQVVSWEVQQTLQGRPVQRGQALLTIVDPQGPWILELHVPDRDIGHVLAARQAIKPDLDVSFLLATQPAQTYRGTVQRVALGSETDESRQATVRVTVRVEPGGPPQRRPGATVSAAIDCGRRALAFVWFHDLWEMIQTRVLL